VTFFSKTTLNSENENPLSTNWKTRYHDTMETIEELERRAVEEQRAELEARRAALAAKKKEEAMLPTLPDDTDIHKRALAVEADIFRTYYTLMTDPTAPAAVRKACADALAERARGKVSQDVTIAGDDKRPVMHVVQRLLVTPTERIEYK